QAEDGIRDATVTGVQTCALPISEPFPQGRSESGAPSRLRRRRPEAPAAEACGDPAGTRRVPTAFSSRSPCPRTILSSQARAAVRSEERRVGKESDCEWWNGLGDK